jgi:outer membrane receptor protein involved in Fe transport
LLGTETSIGYDSGIFHKFGKTLDVRVAANYIDTNNYEVMNGSSLYFGKSYTYEIDHVSFFGYEGEFNWAASERLTVFGNFSHLKNSYQLGAGLPPPELLFLAPKNTGQLSFRYSLPASMRILSDFQFTGKRGTEGGSNLDEYRLGNISLEKKFKNKVALSVFTNNVWNQAYQAVYGFPAAGRTFGVRLQVSNAPSILKTTK